MDYIDDVVTVEHEGAFGGQRPPILLEALEDFLARLVVHMDKDGWVFWQVPGAIGPAMTNLFQQISIGLAFSLRHTLFNYSLSLGVSLEHWVVGVGIVVQVPDVKHAHRCHLIEVPPVAFDGAENGGLAARLIYSVFTGGNIDARHQALQVPFPRTDCSFVKVVKIKDHVTLGSSVESEVVDVCVPGNNHPNAAVGSLGEIPGHDAGCATQIGER